MKKVYMDRKKYVAIIILLTFSTILSFLNLFVDVDGCSFSGYSQAQVDKIFAECINVELSDKGLAEDDMDVFFRYQNACTSLNIAKTLFEITSYTDYAYGDEGRVDFSTVFWKTAMMLNRQIRDKERLPSEKAEQMEAALRAISESLDDREKCFVYIDELYEALGEE